MKELLIFRIFALFPLIGILIPDTANALQTSSASVTPEHLIVGITLSICIIICSVGIWIGENRVKVPSLSRL